MMIDNTSFKKNWKEFKEEAKVCLNEIKNKKTRKKQIPNILTSSRVLAPIFIIPSALLGNIPLTISFIALFALTDTADGFLARKFKATSEFGRKLDPVVDKIFAGTLIIPLITLSPVILVNLVIEALIAHINVKSHLEGYKPKTTYLGKFKTIALNLTIALGYASFIFNMPSNILVLFITGTSIAQAATACQYHSIFQDAKVQEETKKEIINVNTNNEQKEEKSKSNNEKKIDILRMEKEKLLKYKNEEKINDIESPKVYIKK